VRGGVRRRRDARRGGRQREEASEGVRGRRDARGGSRGQLEVAEGQTTRGEAVLDLAGANAERAAWNVLDLAKFVLVPPRYCYNLVR
jgi:hypothetical protein